MAGTIPIVAVELPDSGEREYLALPRSKRDRIRIAAEFGVLQLIDIRMNFIGVHAVGIVPKADDQ